MKVMIVMQPEDGTAEVATVALHRWLHANPVTRLLLRRKLGSVGQGTWVHTDSLETLLVQTELMWRASEHSWAKPPPARVRPHGLPSWDEVVAAAEAEEEQAQATGCCTACGGQGGSSSDGPCPDCLGSGHTHDPEQPCG